MKKVLVFGGTTEGRRISVILSKNGIETDLRVATEYGEELVGQRQNLSVTVGRLDEKEIRALVEKNRYEAVIDATHPFATVVTQNIKKAVGDTVPLLRYKRKTSAEEAGSCTWFESASSCAKALSKTEGNIYLTTGSKDLGLYCNDGSVKKRLLVRVLPAVQSLELCKNAGLEGSQIIAAQGPFSLERNILDIKEKDIKILVTKQSGKTGGMDTKILSAIKTGIKCFIIKNPEEEADEVSAESFTDLNTFFASLEKILGQKINHEPSVNIILGGAGPGNKSMITQGLLDEIKRADVVFGSKRLLESLNIEGQQYPYYLARDIIPVLKRIRAESLEEETRAVVLFSGDSGFYSGSTKLYSLLIGEGFENVRIIPGISSMQYLASRLCIDIQDKSVLSLHGLGEEIWKPRLKNLINENRDVFFLTSGSGDIKRIAVFLIGENKTEYTIVYGYDLSYPDEKVCTLSLEEAMETKFEDEKGLYCGFLLQEEK